MKKSPARVYQPTPRNLAALGKRLARGELVAAPTETVYGLAGNALSARSAKAIFKAKGRPATDPLIVHIATIRQLELVARPNAEALALARAFWPGPLTLILPKTDLVPPEVTSSGESVAVRMPAHPLFLALIRHAGVPLAAPSANPFSYVSPTTAQHVVDGLGQKIAHILDGGPSAIGVESTIIDLRNPRRPVLLRPGAISAAEVARVLKRPVATRRRSTAKTAPLVAPGLLPRHYSPKTRVVLHPTLTVKAARKGPASEAWVFQRSPRKAEANWFGLDPTGALEGAAHSLFATLRRLDQAGFTLIHVELAKGSAGLAAAINDRLKRAAAR